jgi:hypothetical protein
MLGGFVMGHLRLFLGTFYAIVVFSNSAFAQPSQSYSYLAREIPISSVSCQTQAQNLARRFSTLTGLPATARCQSTSPKGNDVLVSYEASAPLNVITTAAELGFPGQGYEFASKLQCESKISAESRAFQQWTGSEPLLAFCRGNENYYGLIKWALIIEGFGDPDKQIGWASSLFPGKPSEVQTNLIKSDVKTMFSDSSLTVRHAFLQDDEQGSLRLTINYFGKYGERIQAQSLAFVNTFAQCETALSELRGVSANNPNIKTLSYCVNNPYALGADLVVIMDVTRWYKITQAPESFATYEQCAAARPGIVETYRAAYPQSVLAGFCTKWGSAWKINFLEL